MRDLIRHIQSPSPELQVYGARALAERKSGAAPAIPYLMDLLPNIEKVVIKHRPQGGVVVEETTTPRAEAIRALSSIGEAAVKPLAAAAKKSETRFRELALQQGVQTDGVGWQELLVEALGKIGKPACGSLSEIVRDTERYHEYVRGAAAVALGRTKAIEASVPLIEALNDPSDHVRGSAAAALGVLGDTAAVEPLFDVVMKKRGPYEPGGWTTERVDDALAALTGKSWSDFHYDYPKWRQWWRDRSR